MSSSTLCRDALASAQVGASLAMNALLGEWQRFGDWAQSSQELRQGAFVSELDLDALDLDAQPA